MFENIFLRQPTLHPLVAFIIRGITSREGTTWHDQSISPNPLNYHNCIESCNELSKFDWSNFKNSECNDPTNDDWLSDKLSPIFIGYIHMVRSHAHLLRIVSINDWVLRTCSSLFPRTKIPERIVRHSFGKCRCVNHRIKCGTGELNTRWAVEKFSWPTWDIFKFVQ